MMRRFMVESVCRWVEEYHIDGFRFDLMGIHDIGTMNAIRAAVDEIDPTVLIILLYSSTERAGLPRIPSTTARCWP